MPFFRVRRKRRVCASPTKRSIRRLLPPPSTRTRVIVVNANNPTGKVYSREELE
jgi:aspartate/methionine/tyrosine aminotransferase